MRMESTDLDIILRNNPVLGIHGQKAKKIDKPQKVGKLPKKQPVNSESQEQIALFDWARLNEANIPELALLHAIPNGGKRHISTAVRLKREGVKSGVPDVFLPVPRVTMQMEDFSESYFGLYIEMKVKGRKTSENQDWWHEQLIKQGYKVMICYNWIEAKEKILNYLGVD